MKLSKITKLAALCTFATFLAASLNAPVVSEANADTNFEQCVKKVAKCTNVVCTVGPVTPANAPVGTKIEAKITCTSDGKEIFSKKFTATKIAGPDRDSFGQRLADAVKEAEGNKCTKIVCKGKKGETEFPITIEAPEAPVAPVVPKKAAAN